MTISIITATWNSSATILDCIHSVDIQTYRSIDHIIIDGASDDNTISLVNSVSSRISQIISEPDNGIYDAMNKGISVAAGEVVGILNSDDLYVDDGVIDKVMEVFRRSSVECVFADLFYVEKSNISKVVRYWKTGPYKPGAFAKGWHPAHPSFFLRRESYDKFGAFDLSFKLASDFELMLRMLEKHKISSYYLPLPLVKMRLGGATNKNFKNIYRQNVECLRAFRNNELNVSNLYPIYRLLPKIKQYFI